MAEDPAAGRDVPVVWVDSSNGKAEYVNQFLSVFQPDEFTIQIGQLAPPPIVGATEQERREQIEALSFVPINLVSRIVMNRTRLVEFIGVLQQNLAAHDEALKDRAQS